MSILIDRITGASTYEPRGGKAFSIILSMISMAILAICLSNLFISVKILQNIEVPVQLVAFRMYKTGPDTRSSVGVSL